MIRVHLATVIGAGLLMLAGMTAAAQSPPGYDCYTGYALSGYNNQTLLNQSLQSCADACRDNGNCRSFDYGFNDRGVCYLSYKSVKDRTGSTVGNPRYQYCEPQDTYIPPAPASSGGARPGGWTARPYYACTEKTALSGHNTIYGKTKIIPGHTMKSCQETCDATPGCISIDFSNSAGTCYLSDASASLGYPTTMATDITYCEQTDDPPPPPPAVIPPATAGGGTAGPGAGPAYPPVALPPDTQTLPCWNTRSQSWSTMTISCVSGPSRTGRGVCADPRAIGLIDQWLAAKASGETKWDCWSRWYPVSPGGSLRTCTGDKPETGGRTRCEFLLEHDLGVVPGLGSVQSYVTSNLD